uniref:Uncharacterized protein n=1 Tax=Heterorhabditis bacteriophora TaxID=37862 RepID=A0A1I7WHL7_HETBA
MYYIIMLLKYIVLKQVFHL